MVSFSCENCNDVITKKKLDAHRNQCRGASFTCLDCHTHFHGTDYRSHTSCITEDQKYQGALYREKPSKTAKRKSVSFNEPEPNGALVPRAAYVEDAPDVDNPPPVPSPPRTAPAQPVEPLNVFDFQVPNDSPNASKTNVGQPIEQARHLKEKSTVDRVDNSENAVSRNGYQNREELAPDPDYEVHGFSYGTESVIPGPHPPINGSLLSLEFMTPATKATKAKLDRSQKPGHARTDSGNNSDKKRKRGDVENQNYSGQVKTPMPDALRTTDLDNGTPNLAHSGLTGGLNRLLSTDAEYFPPTPEPTTSRDQRSRSTRHSTNEDDATSPLKRSRHSKDGPSSGLGISIKGRAGRDRSSFLGGGGIVGALAALANPAAAQNGHLSFGSHSQNGNKETALVKSSTRRRTSWSEDTNHNHHHTTTTTTTTGRELVKHTGSIQRKKPHIHQRSHGSGSPARPSRHHRRPSHSSRSPEARRRKVKAIESPPPHPGRRADDSDLSSAESDDHDGDRRPSTTAAGTAMVLFGATTRRAEAFLNVVTKGPDSARGYSVNKALKRWHRDAGRERRRGGSGHDKEDEERELWRSLRLKRNESGEVVVFF